MLVPKDNRSRKTVNVDHLIAEANWHLARENVTVEFRKGICVMIENVLHATNNYNGYNDIYWSFEGGCELWEEEGKTEERPEKNKYIYGTIEGDQYRRFYYNKQGKVNYPADVGDPYKKTPVFDQNKAKEYRDRGITHVKYMAA